MQELQPAPTSLVEEYPICLSFLFLVLPLQILRPPPAGGTVPLLSS